MKGAGEGKQAPAASGGAGLRAGRILGGDKTERAHCRPGPEPMRCAMIQGRICRGRVETQEPIPKSWEGQMVKIVPLTPEDPLPDLDARLAALHALGPTEFGRGERERIASELEQLDHVSRE